MYDVIIIGGGPAGLAAAVYCLRKRLETLIIAPELGGKANYRMHIAGLEGFEHITGEEIVRKFRSQLQYLEFARIRDMVAKVEPQQTDRGEHFVVTT
ncbi:MAG TPA: FAD-dependent oxidoreductase, partial [Caldilineae bacterium]|nr:FAD-dependent oxidoreductase [Caldilineae bacterium]